MPIKLKNYSIILGAGASKGADVGDRSPPLDSEFLSQAFSLFNKSGRGAAGISDWRDLKKKLKSAGIKTDASLKRMKLEQLSTYLEARANMPALQHSAGKPAKYSKAMTALAQVICRTLEATNGTRHCPIHESLFKLTNPTCIITFNYDLIADQTLVGMNKLAWHKKIYCGGSLRIFRGSRSYTQSRPNRRSRGCVPLLKLHGSMNWVAHQRGGNHSLYTRGPSEKDIRYPSPPPHPLIVAPVASKIEIRKDSLLDIWKEAGRLLRKSPGWIIWGYSFPDLDTVTRVLFRTAIARNRKPKPVIVINPDAGVVDRIKDTLGDKVRVRHFPSIERLLLEQRVLEFSDLSS